MNGTKVRPKVWLRYTGYFFEVVRKRGLPDLEVGSVLSTQMVARMMDDHVEVEKVDGETEADAQRAGGAVDPR